MSAAPSPPLHPPLASAVPSAARRCALCRGMRSACGIFARRNGCQCGEVPSHLAKRRPVTGASPRPPAQRRLHGGDAERHLCILWACGPGSDGPHRCSEIESRPRNVIHQAKLCERALEALPAPALSAASHQKRHVPICPRDPRRPHFPAARSPP